MKVIEPKKTNKITFIVYFFTLLAILFLCIHTANAYDYNKTNVRQNQEESFSFSSLFSEVEKRVGKAPLSIEWSPSSGKFVGGGFFAWILCMGYFITSKRKYINGKEYGTAEWGNKAQINHLLSKNVRANLIKEVKRNKSLQGKDKYVELELIKRDCNEDADMILTDTERISIYNRELNNNTLVIGGSGSGKTRGIVMPNLLQAHSSFVVTDPKGEILSKCGNFLESKGYRVRVLNLFEMDKSSCYNPFEYIREDRPDFEESILILIDSIIMNTNGDEKKGSNDPFWDKAEKLFLQAIFFMVAVQFVDEERNMTSVMELIRLLKIEDDEDDFNSPLDLMFKEFEECYGSGHIAVVQYNEFRQKAAGKTAKSIVISAVARLSAYNLANVQKISVRDELYLDRIGEEKTALFIIMPPTNNTFNFIAGMVFTQLFQELNYCANALHNGHLPIPVRLVMDEFANTCKIPNFVRILAYARSLGIGIMPILQSLEQIKAMYKDEWQVILDNCNTMVFLGGVRNMETLEYVSKLLGKGTFDKKNYSNSKGRQSSSSTSFDKFGRELLDPAEIQKLDKGKCLLFISGYNPFCSIKFDYKLHKNYKYTSDGDKKNTYTYVKSEKKSHDNYISESKLNL